MAKQKFLIDAWRLICDALLYTNLEIGHFGFLGPNFGIIQVSILPLGQLPLKRSTIGNLL